MQQLNNVTIKLKIAQVIIQMDSRFPIELIEENKKPLIGEKEKPIIGEKQQLIIDRLNSFFYNGKAKPDIIIQVDIVDKFPKINKGKSIFTTFHFQDGRENWRLFKKRNGYVYTCPLKGKEHLMLVNKTFDRVKAYLLPKEEAGYVWAAADIIYDFLQVLLINYFAQRNEGIFTHAIGIKDLDKKGVVFAGESGAGKSTTARLWHKHSKATVLNDDRIIVRKFKSKYIIYGSPWHGEFSDYLISKIDSAPLKKLFFIYHSSKNISRKISGKEAFSFLYSALFPTFWDKDSLGNIASFCQDLVKNVPCYRLGFVNDKKVIGFVKKIKDDLKKI